MRRQAWLAVAACGLLAGCGAEAPDTASPATEARPAQAPAWEYGETYRPYYPGSVSHTAVGSFPKRPFAWLVEPMREVYRPGLGTPLPLIRARQDLTRPVTEAAGMLQTPRGPLRAEWGWRRDPETELEAQTLTLYTPSGGPPVAEYHTESAYWKRGLWTWEPSHVWEPELEGDPFRDLNGDGIDDFAFVTSSYKLVEVDVWLSAADGTHRRAVSATMPHVDGERVVSRYPHYRGEDWYVRSWDLGRSLEPTVDVLCGVAPDTTAADGSPLVYVYSRPERVYRSLQDGEIPAPDRLVAAPTLPRLYWPRDGWDDSLDHIRQVHGDRQQAVRDLALSLSLVAREPDPQRYLRAYPQLYALPTARARARLVASVID